MKRRLPHFDDMADLNDGFALGDQLLRRYQLADDLLRRVHGAFHDEVPGPAWPAEKPHAPWTLDKVQGATLCAILPISKEGLPVEGSREKSHPI